MIFSGSKRSATSRANLRITRMGIFAPRYQRSDSSAFWRLVGMTILYARLTASSCAAAGCPKTLREPAARPVPFFQRFAEELGSVDLPFLDGRVHLSQQAFFDAERNLLEGRSWDGRALASPDSRSAPILLPFRPRLFYPTTMTYDEAIEWWYGR